MIVGAVGVYLRSLPMRLWSWLIYQTTMLLTLTDDDNAFESVKESGPCNSTAITVKSSEVVLCPASRWGNALASCPPLQNRVPCANDGSLRPSIGIAAHFRALSSIDRR